MLKKYAKRFSQTVLGGLGPGKYPGAAVPPSSEDATFCENDKYRWPPQSRKVVDDEEQREPSRPIINAKDPQTVRRAHLSSCSSNATSTTTGGEEGFCSESSLEGLEVIKSSSNNLKLERNLIRKSSSSSTSAASSLSSSTSSSLASESLLDMINQLRCTLFYYPETLKL